MQTDTIHLKILRDIKAFTKVKKYRGMLPAKLALFDEDKNLEELLEAGLVNRLFIQSPCGSESRYFKLTSAGHDFLENMSPPDPSCPPVHSDDMDEEDEFISPEQGAVLNDIYHYSKITRNGGIMPNDQLHDFDERIINALFSKGCLIRVKADMGRDRKRKGMMLSEKGVRLLIMRAHETVPAN